MPKRRTLVLTATFIVCIALTFVFGYRAGREARQIRWRNEPIHGWMSVPFIAHTRHVPTEVLYRAIGAEPQPHDRRPIRRIAREQKRPVEQLIQQLNVALNQSGAPAPNTPKRPRP